MKKSVLTLTVILTLIFTVATVASAGPVMDRILKKGVLVVGITGNQLPLSATTKTGEIIGFDAELAKLIAANMGVKHKFAVMPFAELLPALEKGKIDMIISGMTMMPQRNLKVAFVGPYFISGKGILTKADKVAMFQDLKSINNPNVKLAALKGSTSQMFVQRAAPNAKLVPIDVYDKGVDMLIQGKIDALVADAPYCAVTAYRFRDKGLMAGQAKLTFEPLGIALPEDTLLINFVQNYMGVLDGSGALKALVARWFQNADWIKEVQ